MSDVAIRIPSGDARIFQPRTIALVIAVGIIAFIGMMVLGAYAPDMRSGRNGGAHALSNAATGFNGLVRLAAATGREPRIVRGEWEYDTEDLLIITPESANTNISEPLRGRLGKPTLFILPKWRTSADPEHPGWTQREGIVGRWNPEGILSPAYKLKIERRRGGGKKLLLAPELPTGIRFSAPRPLQVIVEKTSQGGDGMGIETKAPRVVPLISDGAGGIVLAQIDGRPLYVLSDPDLLSNIGMKKLDNARSALLLLDHLNSGGAESIGFDVTMNGLGHSRSPLKLAFDPPFLAMTLAIAAALLLAGLYAMNRFGAPRRRERAIAFGKAALVDNSAAMIRRAGRETRMGYLYAGVIRDRAAAAFGVPAGLRDDALDAYLDGLAGSRRFTDLVREARDAENRETLAEAAQALHRWEKEKTR